MTAADRMIERLPVGVCVRVALCGALMAFASACGDVDRTPARGAEGSPEAQHELGTPPRNGIGAHKSLAEAARSYRKAAEQGDANAQFELGTKYRFGHGVPEDANKGASWIRKAADQGDAEAQLNVGAMYANGEVVPKDVVRAYTWTNLAAAQGDALAVKFRDDLERQMTPEQIAEAQRLSREWTEQHTSEASGRDNQ